MAIEGDNAPIVIPCSRCATRTHHALLHRVETTDADEYYEVWVNDEFQLVQCNGCKSISFRHLHVCSEDMYCNRDGELEYDVSQELYPRRAIGRQGLKDVYLLPASVRRIYAETHQALLNDSPVLVGIGIRAIVETVCNESAAQGKDLKQRIDDLVVKKLLTPSGAEVLHELRTLGNKAAHEVKPHSSEQLALAMDAVEHLLEGAYIFPEKAKRTFREGA